ncbi:MULTISPECIES: hypothetical protein [Legionella]|uniref:Uncharacterized protein n=1 Tax=Legionella drozanskii LLAP-1 TaxID=1212489 RepID=A0A0W0SMZ5_9GAMM|nr:MULTISPECIES: hypothetical protein [Legionella]KTC84676.1 hypothetical protein Ldro_2840 [Legionella drozanskii LLAP-1]PJE07884.1 MAG: hypothetical protein CK430_13315 [Legionella sp.]
MKKRLIAAASLIMLIPMFSFAGKLDFKKTFCGNEEFLGNPAKKRPHLHCGSTFMAYKKPTGDHLKISEPGDCNRTNLAFDDLKANRRAFENYSAIYTALVSYHQAGCPNQ